MTAKWTLAGACVVWAMTAGGPAAADNEAYRCGVNSYSQQPCSEKRIDTQENRAPAARKGTVVGARRLPGESDAEFALRSRRASLPQSDLDECKRLDTKIPFEQERLKKAVRAEDVAEVQESLGAARRRFGQLGC